jgi:hypothetical protein
MRDRLLLALGLVPVVLSSWLIGAHFLRFFALELVTLFVLLPLILLVRRAWAVRVMQVALMLGVLIWLRTTWTIASQRAALGEPFGRMALILGTVALIALLSALVLETGPFRRRYRLRTGDVLKAAPARQEPLEGPRGQGPPDRIADPLERPQAAERRSSPDGSTDAG